MSPVSLLVAPLFGLVRFGSVPLLFLSFAAGRCDAMLCDGGGGTKRLCWLFEMRAYIHAYLHTTYIQAAAVDGGSGGACYLAYLAYLGCLSWFRRRRRSRCGGGVRGGHTGRGGYMGV
jgi:hypothetical protein